MAKKITDNQTKEALIKSAVGFETNDVVEEFGVDESGQLKLLKRKITKKTFPPNISALKTLAEFSLKENEFSELSFEELEHEKIRLLKMLSKIEEKDGNNYEKSDD